MVTKTATDFRAPTLKYKKSAYPQSENISLPRQYFVAACIGPRGSGKTYSMTQLLKAYEQSPPVNPDGSKQDIRIFVISPTYDQQECFKALKSIDEQDVYRSYEPCILNEILETIEHEKHESERYMKDMALYKKFRRITSLNQLTNEEILSLDARDYEPPEPPRYPNGVSNFICVDDMVGSSIYKTGRNPFMTLLLRNRHLRTNIFLCCQSVKAVPKTVRANISVWLCFKFGQASILQDLYDEAAGDVPESLFTDMYDAATEEPHSFLAIDFTKPRAQRYSESFRYILSS